MKEVGLGESSSPVAEIWDDHGRFIQFGERSEVRGVSGSVIISYQMVDGKMFAINHLTGNKPAPMQTRAIDNGEKSMTQNTHQTQEPQQNNGEHLHLVPAGSDSCIYCGEVELSNSCFGEGPFSD